jgi:hypothetical protein
MAGGLYDSLNFEQKQPKMAWSKIIFILDLILTKCVIKGFKQQNPVLGDVSIKK